jgi:hypothetical protein
MFVQVGPNWIHGTDDNPILDLARLTGTLTHRWNEKTQIYDEDGNYLSEKEAELYSEIFWNIIIDAFKYSESALEIPPSKSLFDYFKTRIEAIFPDNIQGWERDRTILVQMSERWGAFIGSRITKQSLKFFWLEECIDGGMCGSARKSVLINTIGDQNADNIENLFCAGTYEKILERIAQPVLSNMAALMKLSTEAIKITSNREMAGRMEVSTSAGETLSFDEVRILVLLINDTMYSLVFHTLLTP